jgi:hypothetical protein
MPKNRTWGIKLQKHEAAVGACLAGGKGGVYGFLGRANAGDAEPSDVIAFMPAQFAGIGSSSAGSCTWINFSYNSID